jgi:hypothetical protein
MSTEVAEKEKRRIQRISLPLPVRIDVRIDKQVTWNEITRLLDVSAFGAGFLLKRPLKRGRLCLLTIPMPRQLRCYDHSDPQYKIWALVRRCVPGRSADGEMRYSIGVGFVGKNPPVGFLEKPSTMFDIVKRDDQGMWLIVPSDNAEDKNLTREERRQTRFFIPEMVTLEVLSDEGTVTATESTVTENVSFGGAAVFTSMDVTSGQFVRVSSDRHSIKIISVVRGRRIGPDGLTRLHLEFIDHFFPLEGIE